MNSASTGLAAQERKRAPATGNGILAALPASEYDALVPELEWVYIANGRYMDELGGPTEHAYFPTEGVLSLIYTGEAGECTELAAVGREGMVSVASFMGGHAPSSRALVRAPCFAYRLPAQRLRARFLEGGALQRLLLAYAQALTLNISLVAVCNRHHTLEKQLCRWLLQSLDRVTGRQLRVTQELIALLLGVRRQGVTEALSKLERQGVIACARGVITVKNHAALLDQACDCYGAVRSEAANRRQGPG